MRLPSAIYGTSVVAIIGTLALASCGKKDDDKDAASIPETVTLSGTLQLGTLALTEMQLTSTSAPVAGDVVYCVTFAETPEAGRGALDSAGAFSLTMPGGKAMGCFLTDSAGSTKASFAFASAATAALGGSSVNNVALGKDLNLGTITMGKDGKIAVPYAAISGATAGDVAAKSSAFDLDAMHNATYLLTCVSSGDATIDAACKRDMESGSPTVFWRVVKGTENGAEVRGLGAWASKTAFEACGSIDGTDAEKAAIGVTFSQFSSAAAYTASSTCGLRQSETVRSRDTIQDYYMLSEAKADGAGGFSTKSEHPYKLSTNCTLNHETAIIFTGTADALFGAFQTGEYAGAGCTDQERANAGLYQASFNVKFTKQ